MQIIETPDGKKYEVLKTFTMKLLKSLGKERANEFLDRQFQADKILNHPLEPDKYYLVREIVDVDFSIEEHEVIPTSLINEIAQKKKRGRPKGSKNKPKGE